MRRDVTGPDDLRAMQSLASRIWTPGSRFHPGQLAWNRHFPALDPSAPAADESISLWTDARGETVGFGWAETPEWLELQVDPAHPDVADEVLEWFEEVSDAEVQSALVMEGDVAEPALAAAGFEPDLDAPWLVHHVLDLEALPDDDVRADVGRAAEKGHAVRSVGSNEVAARAAVHAAAWADVGPSPVDERAYAELTRTWPYRSDLDWVVTDRDGAMVASALMWLDPATGVGLLEPVGVVPGHRGRGLARLVTMAALQALRRAGGSRAQVTPRGDDGYPGPQRLYRSIGFTPVARTTTWTRSIS
ncbi:MAG: family acetyltransferase [Humibacillus sp.]|nr:family acetyltransferase [Humibacillus sp.]